MTGFERDWECCIEVRRSRIHGRGIYANVRIPRGELVMVIRGEVISGRECERREDAGNVVIFWNGRTYIDTAQEEKIKYINHDCDPNCEVMDRDRESLNLVAVRDIERGEEITMDYGYDEIYEQCRCAKCGASTAARSAAGAPAGA